MADQEAREHGILAVSYLPGTIPPEPAETGVRLVVRGPDTRTWDFGPAAPAPTVPTAIAPPSTSITELLGKINPNVLAAPQPGPSYPFAQPEPAPQPYGYGYPEPQAPSQNGWGRLDPYAEGRPPWGGQNNYQRNYDDLPEHDRDGGRGGGRGGFRRNVRPGRFKTQVCRFWLKNE